MNTDFSVFEAFVLVFLAASAFSAAALTYLGSRAITSRAAKPSPTAIKDLLANDYYESVSLLVPAYNAAGTVSDTVRSLLKLQHPRFDIVVVDDGSTDDTLARLVEAFGLHEVPIAHEGGIETQPLLAMYRSVDHSNLTVIVKGHGGRADALNAGLNLARRPLICVVDADVVLTSDALAAASLRFVEDETVVAVTGLVRPDARREGDGRSRWAQRFQDADHARRTVAAAGWSAAGATMDVEGFAMFRRRSLAEVGGWTMPSDVETVLALHRLFRAKGQPYRILHLADAIGHMHPQGRVTSLARWRGRRARALATALWGERRMLFRPRFGFIGMVAVPLRWLFDVLAIYVESAAYVYLAAAAFAGAITQPFGETFNLTFAALFVVLAPGSRAVLTQLASATIGGGRTGGAFIAPVVEQLGPAQLTAAITVDALTRREAG